MTEAVAAPETAPANPKHAAPASFFRAYGITLLLCALMLVLAAWPGRGVLLIFFVLPWLLYNLYSLPMAVIRPAQRRWRLLKMGIWIVTIVAVIVAHQQFDKLSRAEAEAVAVSVMAFKERSGRFPKDLDEAGFKGDLTFSRARYSLSGGGPKLFYLPSMGFLDSYQFDFEKKRWIYDAY